MTTTLTTKDRIKEAIRFLDKIERSTRAKCALVGSGVASLLRNTVPDALGLLVPTHRFCQVTHILFEKDEPVVLMPMLSKDDTVLPCVVQDYPAIMAYGQRLIVNNRDATVRPDTSILGFKPEHQVWITQDGVSFTDKFKAAFTR